MSSLLDADAVDASGSTVEHVVLLDERGRPRGTRPKASVHTDVTPFHLAFSCHVVNTDGEVLLTRRAATKRTWPGTWTNACCGHPQLGEDLEAAVRRRLAEELGVRVLRLRVAIPDFAYRAVMADGTVEHELCPVLVAEVDGAPTPDPAEVDDLLWVPWTDVVARAATDPESLSPWSAAQIQRLAALAPSPHRLLVGADAPSPAAAPAGPADAEAALLPVLRPVERLLRMFLDDRSRELAELDPSLAALTGAVHGLVVAGGKRVRPAFVAWGAAAAGGVIGDSALRAGAAIELLHTFALLHDDVMDRSGHRRGLPAAQLSLALPEARDPAWFGVSAAILAGDLTHVWADQLFDSVTLGPREAARARAIYAQLCSEVIAGQYLDLRLAEAVHPTEEAALRVALLKTARYSVTRPLLLGAALADSRPHVDEALARYGDATGLVFQLRDDVLGLFGDPAETGKGCIDDLREGKQTLLVLRALELADAPDAAVLRASLGDRDLDEAGAERCRAVVARSGALASVEARIAAEHHTARAAITDLPPRAAAALAALADLADHRSH